MSTKQKYGKKYWDKVIEYNKNSMTSRFLLWLKKKQKEKSKIPVKQLKKSLMINM